MQPMTQHERTAARITITTVSVDLPVDASTEEQALLVAQIRGLIARRNADPVRLEYLASRVDNVGRPHLGRAVRAYADARRQPQVIDVVAIEREVERLLPATPGLGEYLAAQPMLTGES